MTEELFTIVNVLVQGQAVSAEANVCPMGHKISNERVACELGKARMTTVRKTAIFSLTATVNGWRIFWPTMEAKKMVSYRIKCPPWWTLLPRPESSAEAKVARGVVFVARLAASGHHGRTVERSVK